MTLPIDLKHLLNKLFTRGSTPGERELLNNQSEISEGLQQVWNTTPQQSNDQEKGKRILREIQVQIIGNGISSKRTNPNKYLLAASVTLLLGCGTLSALLITKQNDPEVWYIANSGHQSMNSIRLADGTFVMLNAGSQLTYPKKFRGKQREVQLSGQAFFDVSKDNKHPFVVKTRSMDITALGTSFEVFSFDTDKQYEAILLEGKVKISLNNSLQKQQEFLLNPNDKLAFKENGDITIEQINADTYSAWRTGNGLCFRNEKLSMILPRLEKWYGYRIRCPKEIADHYRFTFIVRDEPLDLVLNIMTSSAPLKYNLVNNTCYQLTDLTMNKATDQRN